MIKKVALTLMLASPMSFAAENYVGGKITSLSGSGSDPAIRVEGNQVPSKCDGGTYGWLYFYGSAQERQWIYSTALAMAVSGKPVTVYTNADGGTCRIHNIEIISGLN